MRGRSDKPVGFHGLSARFCRALAAMTAMVGFAPSASAQCQYEIEAIIEPPVCPPFFNPTFLNATGLNNDGVVCGYYDHCVNTTLDVAFIWTAEGGIDTLLPLPPGFNSARPSDVNDDRVVVGTIFGSGMQRGFIWDDGEWTLIEPLPGGVWAWCNAINETGTVVGGRSIGPGLLPQTAFLYEAGVMTDLFPVPGPNSDALGLSDEGTIVGWTGESSSYHATAFSNLNGRVQFYSPPALRGAVATVAKDANANGSVVGHARFWFPPNTMLMTPMLWQSGEQTALPLLPGTVIGSASFIHDNGLIAGRCNDLAGSFDLPVLWVNGDPVLLETLIIPSLPIGQYDIIDLNENANILIDGPLADGYHAGAILKPIDSSPTDVDGNCVTDGSDLSVLLRAWGSADALSDFNADGVVNGEGLGILLLNWTP